MENDRFDTIAKTIVTATSRRTALAGLFGGVLMLLGRTAAGAGPAASGTCQPKCDRCEKCKKGRCRPKRDGKSCGRFQACRRGRCRELKCGKGGPCRVFVTSSRHQGDIGGLSGADRICERLADRAGLPGRYKAWLSDTDDSPSTRFTNTTNSGPYALVNGTKIANTFADLTDGDLAAPINRTEAGRHVSQSFVWTNTQTDGLQSSATLVFTCEDWTSTSELVEAIVGRSTNTGQGWTDIAIHPCDSPNRLYCFQQG